MPELPEVEIVKKSLKKNVKDKKILDVIVINRNLRFKVDKDFEKILKNRNKIQEMNISSIDIPRQCSCCAPGPAC